VKFTVKTTVPGRSRTGCSVVGVFQGRQLSAAAAAVDQVSGGQVGRIVKRDMEGRRGTALMLHDIAKTASERVLLVGLGPQAEFHEERYREAVSTALLNLRNTGTTDAELHLCTLPVGTRDTAWRVAQAAQATLEAMYRFERMKSKKQSATPALRQLTLAVERHDVKPAQDALREGIAVGEGMVLARDLGNLPGNICTPTYLADQARLLGRQYRMEVEVLERKDMEKLGMGALLSVARGSAQPPKLIVVRYRGGAKKDRPVALVGKGVTFDTGGISIKPAPDMDEMKFDMCGAASVLGTLRAAAELKLPLNVIGVIPATENMPGGRASKPGDIVTTMSGQTVEILNTDAEGRLILCDALTYTERYEPAAVIDIATLTGACVIALGHVATGLFANDDVLADEVRSAGSAAHDRAWHMPLWEDYQTQLNSNFADFANIGGRAAGSVTAACFLSRFAGKFKWAHLDIAGTAWRSGKEKGATGRPVPLLTRFLINRARKS